MEFIQRSIRLRRFLGTRLLRFDDLRPLRPASKTPGCAEAVQGVRLSCRPRALYRRCHGHHAGANSVQDADDMAGIGDYPDRRAGILALEKTWPRT